MKRNTYTKSDVIRRIKSDNNISNEEAKVMVECVLGSIRDYLIKEEDEFRIEIRNFGVFEIKPTKGRKNARNPNTMEVYDIPPRKKVLFRPAKSIKSHLRKLDK